MIFVEQYWQNNRVTVSKDFFHNLQNIFYVKRLCLYWIYNLYRYTFC